MTINALLDVGIGLMTMYLVLSLICTSLNETIASAFNLRAATLGKSLDQIINDPDFKQIFDRHGLIATSSPAGAAPSYLSGATFAPFWFDTLSKFMRVRAAGEKPKPTS